jgi:UDP:flavonoid glycosyltransferase YjiC (YdhE family)
MKFLFTTLFSNDLGLPNRVVPIALELARCGHDVAFCNPEQAPKKLFAEAGVRNIEFEPRSIPTVFPPFTQHIWNMDHFYASYGYQDAEFLRGDCERVMATVNDYAPDVMVDSWNLSACIVARALGKPLVSIMQADMHPANPGFIWWETHPANIPSAGAAVNGVLAEFGLPPIRRTEELHVGDLNVIAGTPETDPLPAGTEVVYVGPILYQKPAAELPHSVMTMDPERPVVWVYTATCRYFEPFVTWGDSIVVMRASIEALADDDVQVLLTTGYRDLPVDPSSLPRNFQYESYVPGVAMARRSDLMIHHGGHGASLTGPYAGVPAVIIPTISERESNARRMASLGAAEFIVPTEDAEREKHVCIEELREKVRRVLAEPSYIQNARRLGERMRAYRGAPHAARLIADFAAKI